ncbi:hypothetical protein SK1NUM_24380 [Arachnia rubra]|jgi:hypothetical protein|nr:hypothetical protein SK1NUM_24380 [Arachnia rubra]
MAIYVIFFGGKALGFEGITCSVTTTYFQPGWLFGTLEETGQWAEISTGTSASCAVPPAEIMAGAGWRHGNLSDR